MVRRSRCDDDNWRSDEMLSAEAVLRMMDTQEAELVSYSWLSGKQSEAAVGTIFASAAPAGRDKSFQQG
ncbi:hypothetical protein GCM10011392_00830 [Wenxinia marina]|nr:hypothetical protein GCM10011392_00830 [Wenxinia marina]